MTHFLCFLLGIVVGAVVLYLSALFLVSVEKVRKAEKSARDTIQLYEQEVAACQKQTEQTTQMLNEILRKRAEQLKQQQVVSATPVVTNNPDVEATVKERLRKAVELTSKQFKIDPRASTEFQLQHNELELEKLCVLKTILADGFDPVITIRYNTGEQEMRLSAYVDSIQKGLA